jgi:hypothetical protein
VKYQSYIYLCLLLSVISFSSFAQMNENEDECDPETQDCSEGSVTEPNKTIYPYKPFDTKVFKSKLNSLHEGEPYLSNVYEMEKRELNQANTKSSACAGDTNSHFRFSCTIAVFMAIDVNV